MPPGPRPQPTVVRLVRGNKNKRPVNDREPQLPVLKLDPPAELDEEHKAIWLDFAELLTNMRVLTIADASALMRLTRLKVRVEKLERDIDDNGYSYTTTDQQGNTHETTRPEVRAWGDADRRYKQYLTEFGLTPSSRTRVKTNGPATQPDKTDDFF
jgi:P27 family predicted phage terminase small subunit